VGDQEPTDRSIARQDVDDACGQVDFVDHLSQKQCIQRGFGSRLEHHGAAGQQRGHQLGDDEELGHVPRHDRGDYANRLLLNEHIGAEEAGPGLLPVVSLGEVAERAHHHRGQSDLGALGKGDGGADLGRDGLGHLGAPLVVDVGETADRRVALRRFAAAPGSGVERGACRVDGVVDVGPPRRGDLGDGLLGVR
jgi:ParB family chromosome partitioning protein